MGRKRESNFSLPPRMHQKGTMFYYVTSTRPRKWLKLDKDLSLAKLKWAKLEAIEVDDRTKSFANIVRLYIREVLPGKAPQTQKDNHKEIKKLLPVFGEMPIDKIEPQDVRNYLDLRGQTAKVRANREKALLSHIFNFARGRGFTALANPCEGISGFTEKGRDVYVEDEQFKAVWEAGDCAVRDAMDLAYLTGQRPSDTLGFSETNIQDDTLNIKQRKTEQKLRIPIVGRLAEVIERIRERKRVLTKNGKKVISLALVINEHGRQLGKAALRARFDKARQVSGVDFQFRDIRAKSGTDLEDLAHAQKLLGHRNRATTERYLRKRRGESVAAVNKKL